MPSGKVPIAESSTIAALMSRQWSPRGPLPAGALSLLTVACWAFWIYLVLPLVSLLLWVLGIRRFMTELSKGSYEGLRTSLVNYSLGLVALTVLLALWIVWNVVRYGGDRDRRTVKREEVSNLEILQAFRLDDSLLAVLRDERLLRLDLDPEGCVMVIPAQPTQPALPHAQRPAAPQPAVLPERSSTRSG
jgi:poly-beta-1,6-N-acetyl-D-glucosamine biosynthesis protein PgaD